MNLVHLLAVVCCVALEQGIVGQVLEAGGVRVYILLTRRRNLKQFFILLKQLLLQLLAFLNCLREFLFHSSYFLLPQVQQVLVSTQLSNVLIVFVLQIHPFLFPSFFCIIHFVLDAFNVKLKLLFDLQLVYSSYFYVIPHFCLILLQHLLIVFRRLY